MLTANQELVEKTVGDIEEAKLAMLAKLGRDPAGDAHLTAELIGIFTGAIVVVARDAAKHEPCTAGIGFGNVKHLRDLSRARCFALDCRHEAAGTGLSDADHHAIAVAVLGLARRRVAEAGLAGKFVGSAIAMSALCQHIARLAEGASAVGCPRGFIDAAVDKLKRELGTRCTCDAPRPAASTAGGLN